jgi:hypothetical protein
MTVPEPMALADAEITVPEVCPLGPEAFAESLFDLHAQRARVRQLMGIIDAMAEQIAALKAARAALAEECAMLRALVEDDPRRIVRLGSETAS